MATYYSASKESQQQCLTSKHYTCADKQSSILEEIKAGSVVFLYNTDDKTLVGPFTTLPEGDELDAGAWAENVDKETPYDDIQIRLGRPAQNPKRPRETAFPNRPQNMQAYRIPNPADNGFA